MPCPEEERPWYMIRGRQRLFEVPQETQGQCTLCSRVHPHGQQVDGSDMDRSIALRTALPAWGRMVGMLESL